MAESLSDISKASISANTTLSSNLGKATNVYDGINSQADEDIDSLMASAFDKLRSVGFNGVTGLEIDKVKDMKKAITDYVGSIKKALEPLNSSDATNAFGAKMKKAIENFVIQVKNSCNGLISNMEAFNADLDAIEKAMVAKAESVSAAVDTQSSKLESSTSGWTYNGSNESK